MLLKVWKGEGMDMRRGGYDLYDKLLLLLRKHSASSGGHSDDLYELGLFCDCECDQHHSLIVK